MARIVIAIATLSGGGAERVAVRLADLWSAAGHEVCLVTLSSDAHDAYRPRESVERVALDAMGRSRTPVQGLSRGTRRVSGLRRVLRERRPDLVLGMMTSMNVLVTLAHVGLDGALIVAERNYPPRSTRSRVWSTLRRVTYRRADVVLALESRGRAWLERHTSARRVETIPNAVRWPLPRLEPIREPADVYPPGSRRLLAVGRLMPQKGFVRLLHAFARALAHADSETDEGAEDGTGDGGRPWHLVIAGEGPERATLERLIDTLDLAARVTLAGRVGNIGDWFDAADLYVLASHHEGFPGALLEAMACGCAVLAVDCRTGPADIIEDGVDGVLVDDDDDALALGLTRLMEDAAWRHRLAAAAPGVRERFGESVVMARWTALLTSVGVPPSPDPPPSHDDKLASTNR